MTKLPNIIDKAISLEQGYTLYVETFTMTWMDEDSTEMTTVMYYADETLNYSHELYMTKDQLYELADTLLERAEAM
jgi:hypothetical protein